MNNDPDPARARVRTRWIVTYHAPWDQPGALDTISIHDSEAAAAREIQRRNQPYTAIKRVTRTEVLSEDIVELS